MRSVGRHLLGAHHGACFRPLCWPRAGCRRTGGLEHSTLVGRAQLVVDDTVVALREAGDLIIAIGQAAIGQAVITPASLVPMRDIITGQTPVDHHRPRVFNSSGMSWEDLVIAAEVYRAG